MATHSSILSGTCSGDLRKDQSPCELLGGLSGSLSRRCQGLRHCVEMVPEPQDYSPVLTRILRDFWSLPREVSPRLQWWHVGTWIYLWGFYFVLLIYISVFVPVPYCLDDCCFVVEPEVRQVDSSSGYCFKFHI